ncbi:MAG: hypothetical protein ACK2UK_09380 [Candidatus Promineifilaceae bacterium]
MSEGKNPDMDELKERIEISIEDDDVEQLKADEKASQGPDLVLEFQSLGKAFAEAFESAWNSEERKRVEQEVRDGVKSFADEVDKVIRDAKQSSTGERVKHEAEDVAQKFEASDIGRRALEGIAQGLSWMSVEMGRLAEQFTPAEKAPEDPNEDETQA